MRKRVEFAVRCVVVLLMVVGVVGSWAVAHAPEAFAGDSDKKEVKDSAKKNENGRRDGDSRNNSKKNNNVGDGEGGRDDNDEEHDTTGQVMEIRTEAVPQEIIIANGDGKVTVKLMKAKLIEQSDVHLGDHVRVTGEKVHEFLFEATQINIRVRCCGEAVSDNDSDSDNVSDPGTIERGYNRGDQDDRDDDDEDD
ncbi:MAG: hypothetical protein ACKVVP_08680 [Chloroflexota bacterium]